MAPDCSCRSAPCMRTTRKTQQRRSWSFAVICDAVGVTHRFAARRHRPSRERDSSSRIPGGRVDQHCAPMRPLQKRAGIRAARHAGDRIISPTYRAVDYSFTHRNRTQMRERRPEIGIEIMNLAPDGCRVPYRRIQSAPVGTRFVVASGLVAELATNFVPSTPPMDSRLLPDTLVR